MLRAMNVGWTHLAGIAGAGAVGALARFGLSAFLHRWQPAGFPTGTLVVNLLGCFLFGLVWSLLGHRIPLDAPVRATVFVGFLGSFTTFSTFAFETHHLLERGEGGLALTSVVVSVAGGVALAWAGIALGRLLAPGAASV
jgi:CrcB protein